MNDRTIERALALARAGDPSCVSLFFSHYSRLVSHIISKSSVPPDLIEDLTHDVFIELTRPSSLLNLNDENHAKNRIAQITRRTVLNWQSRKSNQGNSHELIEEIHGRIDSEYMENNILLAEVRDFIDKMSSTIRIPFIMHVIYGRTHHEIASELDISVQMSRQLVMQVRDRIRDRFEKDLEKDNDEK